MRYKTSTSTTTSSDSSGNEIKTITTSRTPYVTIGDIIGAGVTASSAVSKLSAMKNNPNVLKTAAGSLVGPLVALVKTMDAYKAVMNVIDKVTPAVQLVARGSGLFHSPGNIGDMLNIIWGKVQKVLVTLALSAVTTMKDIIWAMEIPFPSIDSSVSTTISKAVTSTGESIAASTSDAVKNAADIINEDTDISVPDEVVELQGYSNESNDEIQKIISSSKGESTTVLPSGSSCSMTFNFVKDTGVVFDGEKYSRMIAGSSQSKGLFYSDDGGETWTSSNITYGSWVACDGSGSTFCAGSVGTYTESSDTSFSSSKQYYSDYGGLIRLECPASLGLYAYSDGADFVPGTSYYRLDGGMSCTYATPESLGLYSDSSMSVPSSDAEFSWSDGNGHYYYNNGGTAEIATPAALGLVSSSSDKEFYEGRKYFSIDGTAYKTATPATMGLLEESVKGLGILYSTDCGTTWKNTNKNTGSCNAIYMAEEQTSFQIEGGMIMASASNEGLWYCCASSPETWNASNVASGNYHSIIGHGTKRTFYSEMSASASVAPAAMERMALVNADETGAYAFVKRADIEMEG